jgi:hypothetical protein
LTLGLITLQSKQPQEFKLTTFSTVPEQLEGCGASYYLSEQDRKTQKRFICTTDMETALVYINGKPLFLNISQHFGGYESGKFVLIIKDGPYKQIDSEYSIMKSVFTLKYGLKIIWTKTVFGT